jgi:hypothetical protein
MVGIVRIGIVRFGLDDHALFFGLVVGEQTVDAFHLSGGVSAKTERVLFLRSEMFDHNI